MPSLVRPSRLCAKETPPDGLGPLLFTLYAHHTHWGVAVPSEEEAKQFLWTSYSGAVWRGFGGWNKNGAIPEHYILPKYKDIVADCAVVMEKKGQ